jgi:hypothetical protein
VSTVSNSYFDLPSRIEDAFAEIDSDIVMDLLNTGEDYAELSDRMDKLKTQCPVIGKMNEGSGEIRMTAEEHRAYLNYLNLARKWRTWSGSTSTSADIPMPWPTSRKSKQFDADGTEPPCRFLILLPIQALYLHIFQKSICR